MAVLFDANDEAIYRDTNLPNPNGSWTVMFWVYFNALAASTLYDCMWLHTPTGGVTSYIGYFAFNLNQYAEMNGGATATSGPLGVATWYHFALTCNSGFAPLMYRDGVQVGTMSASVPVFTAARMRFGNRPEATRNLNGRLKDIKVWDANLSAAEVQADRLSPLLVRTANINCFYKLNDASTAATDSSGLGRTATISGTPTTAPGPQANPPIWHYTQEGYRWRNDDGSESAATWMAAQDTAVSVAPDETKRIRFLVDAAGDPLSDQFKLQYRKVGDASWRDIDQSG